MNSRQIEFVQQVEYEVNMIGGSKARSLGAPKPLTITPAGEYGTTALTQKMKALTIHPSPPKDYKAVPWTYPCESISMGEKQDEKKTRSGKTYTTTVPEKTEERKEILQEPEPKKVAISEGEITEFLKLIKKSDYSIVDQLNK